MFVSQAVFLLGAVVLRCSDAVASKDTACVPNHEVKDATMLL